MLIMVSWIVRLEMALTHLKTVSLKKQKSDTDIIEVDGLIQEGQTVR